MRGKKQRIAMRNTETNKEMIFDSYASAAKYVGSDTSTIRKACLRKGRKKVGQNVFYNVPEWYGD